MRVRHKPSEVQTVVRRQVGEPAHDFGTPFGHGLRGLNPDFWEDLQVRSPIQTHYNPLYNPYIKSHMVLGDLMFRSVGGLGRWGPPKGSDGLVHPQLRA